MELRLHMSAAHVLRGVAASESERELLSQELEGLEEQYARALRDNPPPKPAKQITTSTITLDDIKTALPLYQPAAPLQQQEQQEQEEPPPDKVCVLATPLLGIRTQNNPLSGIFLNPFPLHPLPNPPT